MYASGKLFIIAIVSISCICFASAGGGGGVYVPPEYHRRLVKRILDRIAAENELVRVQQQKDLQDIETKRLKEEEEQRERLIEHERQMKVQDCRSKEIDDERKRLESLEKENSDPRHYIDAKARIFNEFVDRLTSLKFVEVISRRNEYERHAIVIGNISSGKSTFIGHTFGIKLETSPGRCTLEAKQVHEDLTKNLVVWDAPGDDEDFSYLNITHLNFFRSVDQVVFLWADSPRTIKDAMVAVNKIREGRGMIFARSKCNVFDESDVRTPMQETILDREYLESIGIHTDKVYCIGKTEGYDTAVMASKLKDFPRLHWPSPSP